MTTNTSSPDIAVALTDALVPLRAVLRELSPLDIPLPEVTEAWSMFAEIRRLAANGETLLTGQVAKAREWSRSGYPTPEEWIAAKNGTSVGQARTQVQTSNRLEELGETTERVKAGRLSVEQADIVSDAATINPNAETALCDQAERDSNKNLRDEAARRKAQARPDPAERARRHHRERAAARWCDRDGKQHWRLEGPTAAFAAFNADVDREIERRFRAAARAGKPEPRQAYAFDAIIALLTRAGGGEPPPGRAPDIRHLALIRADLSALVRGDVVDGEVCEIPGTGPIPVEAARELLGDSILKLVCTRGVDVHNVTHLGRGASVAQQVALLWSDQTCRAEGCHRTHVENDHRIDFAETRHTRLDELDPLCDRHHDHKTYKGWALVAGTGKRPFVPPDDSRHPRHHASNPSPSDDHEPDRDLAAEARVAHLRDRARHVIARARDTHAADLGRDLRQRTQRDNS